jgi:hypothetical protein
LDRVTALQHLHSFFCVYCVVFPVFSHDGTRLQLTANDLDQLRMMSGMLTEEQNEPEEEEEEEEEEEHADDDTGPGGRQGHGDLDDNPNSHTSHVASSREQRAPAQHQASSHQRPKLQNRQDLQPKRQQREGWSSRRTGTLGAFQVVSKFPVTSLPQ